MGVFYVRVELHKSDDYSELHEAMKGRGFSRKIKDGKSGKWYKLPSGMYRKETNTLDRHGVLSEVKAAAQSVDDDYEALVVESAGATWANLEPLS